MAVTCFVETGYILSKHNQAPKITTLSEDQYIKFYLTTAFGQLAQVHEFNSI